MILRGEGFWRMLDLGFGDPNTDMKTYVDSMFAKLYGSPDALDFSYTRVSDSLTYEVLKGEFGITSIATFMPENAHAKSKPFEEGELLTGKIVPFKNKQAFNNNDLRELTLMFNRMDGLDAEGQKFVRELVWRTYNAMLKSNTLTVSYMRDQAVCKGYLEIDGNNNPDSPLIGQKFDFKVPADNRKTPISSGYTGEYWWNNDGTPNTAAYPINDLITLQAYAKEDKYKVVGAMELSSKTWRLFAAHPNVKNAITVAKFPNSDADNAALLATWVRENDTKVYIASGTDLPPFVIRETSYKVDKLDIKKAQLKGQMIKGFDDDVIVMRPAKNYGEIKSGAIVMPIESSPSTVLFNGRTKMVRTYDDEESTYWLESTEISLAVLTDPDGMFYLGTLTNPTP